MKLEIYFLGNANKDSRITNLKNSLENEGHTVNVVSFDWFTENFVTIKGDVNIYKISKKFSILFYLHFALITIRHLISSNAKILFAEDVYTLPFVGFIGKIKGKKVIYNSREFYAFLGGLTDRKKLQMAIAEIERLFIKFTDLVLTTGKMDSEFLEKLYKLNNTCVIRNIPLKKKTDEVIDFRNMLNIEKSKTILLYQGVLLKGRGVETILHVVSKLPMCDLVILGDGVLKDKLVSITKQLNIENRVHFLGTIIHKDLDKYTAGADIGFCLIENISISYYYALPNKLFEYINAKVPVIGSNLPQIKQIVEDYKLGEIIEIDNISFDKKVDRIVDCVNKMLFDKQKYLYYKTNCEKAADELNWETEYLNAKNRIFEGIN